MNGNDTKIYERQTDFKVKFSLMKIELKDKGKVTK